MIQVTLRVIVKRALGHRPNGTEATTWAGYKKVSYTLKDIAQLRKILKERHMVETDRWVFFPERHPREVGIYSEHGEYKGHGSIIWLKDQVK